LLVFLPVFCAASEGTTNEVAPSAVPCLISYKTGEQKSGAISDKKTQPHNVRFLNENVPSALQFGANYLAVLPVRSQRI